MSVAAAAGRDDAVFTRGSTMRHVVVMSSTGAVGLLAIFAVDLLSLLYISWLKDVNITAGVGFATTVGFFAMSVNIGLVIAVSAVVSRALGARDRAHARRLAASALAHSAVVSALVAVLMMASMHLLLQELGAAGQARDVAVRFLTISMPSNVLMGLGMAFSGVLRAAGDARRGMFVTLSGGLVTAVVDPLLIFGAGLGADGAAWAVVLSRVTFCVVGYRAAVRVHDLVAPFDLRAVLEDVWPVARIAAPAIATNLATPVANGFMTSVIAPFGESAVAANAIMMRLAPVAFAAVFALTGAVGPIFGQNLGARLYDRVRRTLTDGLVFTLTSVLVAWAALFWARDAIIFVFAAQGETAELVGFFCTVLAGSWMFHGALYVANSAFNNLGFPLLATAFNWGKATLGTIPFAVAGARLGGPEGALLGQAAGAVLFGLGGAWAAYAQVGRLARKAELAPVDAVAPA
jgi:putative MATE family efflux protein